MTDKKNKKTQTAIEFSLPVPIGAKLQVLVYDILPPATAIVDYAIGLEKLSACEQFFDDAQIAASW